MDAVIVTLPWASVKGSVGNLDLHPGGGEVKADPVFIAAEACLGNQIEEAAGADSSRVKK